MLSVIVPNVVMLSVVMLSVGAPVYMAFMKKKEKKDMQLRLPESTRRFMFLSAVEMQTKAVI
jgi:hypothetical protein